jgi:hypothetical protein
MAEAGEVIRDPPVHRWRCFASPLREEQTSHLDPGTREAPSRSENKGEARRIYTHTGFSVPSDLRNTYPSNYKPLHSTCQAAVLVPCQACNAAYASFGQTEI